MPLRLLDLRQLDSACDGIVSLREHPDSELKYATLSYCWGGEQKIKLDSSTYASLVRGLPLSRLPLNFRQVFPFIHKLGFEYVWVDVLCIRQDSDEDKAKEIQKMPLIYEGSTLTIALASSSGVETGVFFPLDDKYLPSEIPCSDLDSRFQGVSIRQRPPHVLESGYVSWSAIDKLVNFRNTETRVLFTRGWYDPLPIRCNNSTYKFHNIERTGSFKDRVFQEIKRSRRVVFLDQCEIHWRCICKVSCQCGESMSLKPPRALQHIGSIISDVRDQSEELRLWMEIVSEYSTCQLTIPSDRHHAITGIADRFTTLGQYELGIWDNCLHYTLLWILERHNFDEIAYASRLDWRHRLWPSWSWYSVCPGQGQRVTALGDSSHEGEILVIPFPSTIPEVSQMKYRSTIIALQLTTVLIRAEWRGETAMAYTSYGVNGFKSPYVPLDPGVGARRVNYGMKKIIYNLSQAELTLHR